MKDFLTTIVLKQKAAKAKPLPIKYWQVWTKTKTGMPLQLVDENNSIPLMRNKWGNDYLYKAIR